MGQTATRGVLPLVPARRALARHVPVAARMAVAQVVAVAVPVASVVGRAVADGAAAARLQRRRDLSAKRFAQQGQ